MKLRTAVVTLTLLPLVGCSSGEQSNSSSAPVGTTEGVQPPSTPAMASVEAAPGVGTPSPPAAAVAPGAAPSNAPAPTPVVAPVSMGTPDPAPVTPPEQDAAPIMTPAPSDVPDAPITPDAPDEPVTPAPIEMPAPVDDMAATPEPAEPAAGAADAACTRDFLVPTFDELEDNPKLPDPFTFLDGTKVATKADWTCRKKEIRALAEAFIYGPKPSAPESVEATYSNGTLDITVSDGGRSIDFSVDIDTPSGDGPHPGVFDIGGSVSGAASIKYGDVIESLARSSFSQGRQAPSGKFYDLYPDSTDTGSLMAWAWGASRVVDALEITEGHNIDTTKLTAQGCSRNGKTAATITLFDERFALVSAMSPGSGTTSGWRVAEANSGNVQTAGQIFGEDTWMGEGFEPFGGDGVTRLPIDQHTVLALAWPRPLLILEGTNDSWNCPECVYTTLKYTQKVYEALGTPDYIGFAHPDHGHCAQSGTFAMDYWEAFTDRFLKGDESVSTADMFTESFDFDADRWQDGEIPTLQ